MLIDAQSVCPLVLHFGARLTDPLQRDIEVLRDQVATIDYPYAMIEIWRAPGVAQCGVFRKRLALVYDCTWSVYQACNHETPDWLLTEAARFQRE